LGSTKLAILDLDGTLYSGTLGIDLLQELVRENLFHPRAYEQVVKTLESHEQGGLTRRELATRLYTLCGEGIAGLGRDQVAQAAAAAWERNKYQVFPFVEELLSTLSRRGYTTVLMTGSPTEIVHLFARTYAVDHVYAADFETRGDRYTGQLLFSPGRQGQKRHMLQRIAHELEADLGASLVLGDSENDFEMFDRVGVPVAMNSKGHLSLQYQSKGWRQATPATLLPSLKQWLR
jgi:HAD superfamily hydrolase (TIGR01490 family)